MKRILLTLGLLALPVALFAQGTVQFLNTSTTTLSTNTTSFPPPGQLPNVSGLTAPAGQYVIGLFIAPQGTTDPNAFTLMGPTTLNQGGVAPGRFNGGSSFIISNNTGQTIAFQIRAWHATAGATYDAAQLAQTLDRRVYLGSSAIGQVTPATAIGQPASLLFGTSAGQIGGFVLTPGIPEPSSIALGLLGLGAIALFRRRK